MEQKPTSLLKKTLLYGLILGITMIVYSYVLYLAKLDKNTLFSLVQYVFMITAIVIAIQCYRNRECEGYISYGKAFGTGVLTVLWASILVSVYTYIFMTMIAPDIMEQTKALTMEKLENSGNEEQMEAMSGVMNAVLSPGFVTFMAFVVYVFIGTIFSLVIAAFLKKDKDIFTENTSEK
jgi:hypothetical protein